VDLDSVPTWLINIQSSILSFVNIVVWTILKRNNEELEGSYQELDMLNSQVISINTLSQEKLINKYFPWALNTINNARGFNFWTIDFHITIDEKGVSLGVVISKGGDVKSINIIDNDYSETLFGDLLINKALGVS